MSEIESINDELLSRIIDGVMLSAEEIRDFEDSENERRMFIEDEESDPPSIILGDQVDDRLEENRDEETLSYPTYFDFIKFSTLKSPKYYSGNYYKRSCQKYMERIRYMNKYVDWKTMTRRK